MNSYLLMRQILAGKERYSETLKKERLRSGKFLKNVRYLFRMKYTVVHTYIHIYIHIYINTHIYIYICKGEN